MNDAVYEKEAGQGRQGYLAHRGACQYCSSQQGIAEEVVETKIRKRMELLDPAHVTTVIVQNATLVTRDDDKRKRCEDIAAIGTPEESLEEKE